MGVFKLESSWLQITYKFAEKQGDLIITVETGLIDCELYHNWSYWNLD